VPDDLRTVLLDLLHELEETGTNVMLGGGYGLFLKQEHLASTGATTWIPSDRWPTARSTKDIDFLLHPARPSESVNENFHSVRVIISGR
jgi:hypothetical protein